jgi:hypothetical protein
LSAEDRWIALVERDAGRDPAIRAGLWKAWVDRQNWPAELQQQLAAFKVEHLTRFIHEAIWEFTERQRQRPREPRPPDRVHPDRISLFHRIKEFVVSGGIAGTGIASFVLP